MAGDSVFELRTFGGLDLRAPDGQKAESALAQSKGMALLAYLAADAPETSPVRRDRVVALLWPHRDQTHARNALRTTLSRLREALGGDALGGKGEQALWLSADGVGSDVRAFQRAVEEGRPRDALELYEGPFLDGFHVSGAAPFERWLDERREEYRRQAYEAALDVGRSAREEGDLEAAEAALRRAREIAPVREPAVGELMEVLAERGDRAGALQTFASFRERLDSELDLSPSDGLVQTARRLRRGAGRDDERPAEASAPEEPSTSASPRPRPESAVGEGAPGEAGEPAAAPARGDSSSGRSTAHGPVGRALGALVGLGVLAAAGVGVWHLVGSAGTPELEGRSVAVLPFESIGSDGGETYFADGMHEEVLTRLAQIDGLTVISRSSVERYRGTDRDVRTIADELGVEAVLEGSIRRAGDEVRISAQLIDGDTGTHVWARTYEENVSDVFRVQADLARRIAEALDAEIAAEKRDRLAKARTQNPAAYDLYLRAMALEDRSRQKNETAVELLRQAIRRDSSFAAAYAGLADAYLSRTLHFGFPRSWADSAARTARRAVELDPNLADGHEELGTSRLFQGRTSDAIREFEQALELRPGHAATLNNLGFALMGRGEYGEAYRQLREAARVTPRNSFARVNLASAAIAFRRDSVAQRWLGAADSLCDGPGCGDRVYVWYHLMKGADSAAVDRTRKMRDRNPSGMRALTAAAQVAHFRGHLKEARRLLERAREQGELNLGPSTGVRLAHLMIQTGDRRAGLRFLGTVEERARKKIEAGSDDYDPRYRLAAAAAVRGDADRALSWLRKAYRAGWPGERWVRADPLFASVRSEDGAQRLLDRVQRDLMEMRQKAGL